MHPGPVTLLDSRSGHPTVVGQATSCHRKGCCAPFFFLRISFGISLAYGDHVLAKQQAILQLVRSFRISLNGPMADVYVISFLSCEPFVLSQKRLVPLKDAAREIPNAVHS